jgi:hypothetical protein
VFGYIRCPHYKRCKFELAVPNEGDIVAFRRAIDDHRAEHGEPPLPSGRRKRIRHKRR